LTFGDNFDQPVSTLPETLTHLTFGYYFNQPVPNLLLQRFHIFVGILTGVITLVIYEKLFYD